MQYANVNMGVSDSPKSRAHTVQLRRSIESGAVDVRRIPKCHVAMSRNATNKKAGRLTRLFFYLPCFLFRHQSMVDMTKSIIAVSAPRAPQTEAGSHLSIVA